MATSKISHIASSQKKLTPDQQSKIDATASHIKKLLSKDASGHDWWHIYRVWKLAIHIANKENADLFIVQLAALVHDIADWKFHQGDDKLNAKVASEWLENINVDKETIIQVCNIVNEVSFKGAGVENGIRTLEGKVVQDADRLDALGATGIARTFAYGGFKGIPMHDPDLKPTLHSSFNEYKNHKGTTINHFYEKLLLLKDRMNTATGKQLAESRHNIMLNYLEQFFSEWGVDQP
jgi:uncharacterized protein